VTRALRHPPLELKNIKEQTRSRRDTLCDALDEIDGLIVHRPAGGMFVMVDVSALVCDGAQFANELLDQEGVAVVPGFAFGDSVQNCIRIGYLHDEVVLREAADRIREFVDGLSA